MARLDRDPPEAESTYANSAEVGEEDRTLLESPTGRVLSTDEQDSGELTEEVRGKRGGARPVRDATDFHLSGTGAIETEDGLDESAESLRHSAEDLPDEDVRRREDGSVFDRWSGR